MPIAVGPRATGRARKESDVGVDSAADRRRHPQVPKVPTAAGRIGAASASTVHHRSRSTPSLYVQSCTTSSMSLTMNLRSSENRPGKVACQAARDHPSGLPRRGSPTNYRITSPAVCAFLASQTPGNPSASLPLRIQSPIAKRVPAAVYHSAAQFNCIGIHRTRYFLGHRRSGAFPGMSW